MSTQRCCACEPTALQTCKICGEAFAIVRKPGRPRDYCFVCEPPGWQVVRVAAWQEWRTRPYWWKLRRRPPRLPRLAAVAQKVSAQMNLGGAASTSARVALVAGVSIDLGPKGGPVCLPFACVFRPPAPAPPTKVVTIDDFSSISD